MADKTSHEAQSGPESALQAAESPTNGTEASSIPVLAAQCGSSPAAYAEMLREQPTLQRELVRFLHQRFGNAFVQRVMALARASNEPDVHAAAAHGISGAGGALPFLDTIQRSFGRHDVTGVTAHTDAAAAEGAREMGAEAFAQGNHVAFAGTPDLHTAAHEAAHVVQQRSGVQLKSGTGEVGDDYETHADAIADAVVRGEPAESLLDQHASEGCGGGGGDGSAVQRSVRIGRTSVTSQNVAKLSALPATDTFMDAFLQLSLPMQELIRGDAPLMGKVFNQDDKQVVTKFQFLGRTPTEVRSNVQAVGNLPDARVRECAGFRRLVNDIIAFSFDRPEQVVAALGDWDGTGKIPPRLMAFGGENVMDPPLALDGDMPEHERQCKVGANLNNCGQTAKALLGRINQSSGDQLRRLYGQTLKGDRAGVLTQELTAQEEQPVLFQITVEPGVHVFTLEVRNGVAVLHQGYQQGFNAMWWAGAGPGEGAGDFLRTSKDESLSKKRDTFGKGAQFAIGPFAEKLARFLGCSTYHHAEVLPRWKELPFVGDDQQVKSQVDKNDEQPIEILVEKYILREGGDRTSQETLGGEGSWLTTRVMTELRAFHGM